MRTADTTGRYGAPSPWVKPAIVVSTTVLVVLAVVWAIWSVFVSQGPHVEARDIGHTVNTEQRTVTVEWELSVTEGTETACAVAALNEAFQTVGWKVVTIPASNEYTRAFSETVRVAMPANTGFVSRCWVP